MQYFSEFLKNLTSTEKRHAKILKSTIYLISKQQLPKKIKYSYLWKLKIARNRTSMTSDGWIFNIMDSSKGLKWSKGQNRFPVKKNNRGKKSPPPVRTCSQKARLG